MADEKVMVSTNALNAAFKKQMEKRVGAPDPTPERAAQHLAAVVAAPAVAAGDFDFVATWKKYYPMIVSLLGYADWFIPGAAVKVLKALFAAINNTIIPIFERP